MKDPTEVALIPLSTPEKLLLKTHQKFTTAFKLETKFLMMAGKSNRI